MKAANLLIRFASVVIWFAILSACEGEETAMTGEYSPPYDRPYDYWADNVVKDKDGLPLPAFGPLPVPHG